MAVTPHTGPCDHGVVDDICWKCTAANGFAIQFEFIEITRAHVLMLSLVKTTAVKPGWYWRMAGRAYKSPLDGYAGPFPSEAEAHTFCTELVKQKVAEANARAGTSVLRVKNG